MLLRPVDVLQSQGGVERGVHMGAREQGGREGVVIVSVDSKFRSLLLLPTPCRTEAKPMSPACKP